MTEKSYPRLENGVVIYGPEQEKAPEKADSARPTKLPAAKPSPASGRSRRSAADDSDET